jgi:beta-lactam-binding protein with PASTA domain/predicted Ser/Thr protein kinase
VRLEAGQQIGDRYRLVQRVGSGGMADVWSADDSMLGRRVALKFLHERFGADEQFVERFRREAQAAAGLQHPNVVSVYDRGEHEGRYWIAMEYVHGASLKDLIERGLSPAEAVEIVRQVLNGVRFAHERGIVHRDLKPHNVLVDAEGRARVTDFGIARAGASEITQTGSVLGTAQYLSPEQAQGLDTTASADIYSVGVILYEALTGQVPFDAETAVAIALKQISEPPVPPRQINPEIPPALNAVVLKALAKAPADRYANATEFLRALDAAEANPAAGGTAVYAAVVDPLPEEEEDNRWKWIALAVLALLIIAGVVFALTRPDKVLVPSVIGDDRQVATDELESKGFEVVASDFESCDVPNTVSETDPPAGERVEKGSEVEISVSLGLQVAIPSKGVIGETVQDATKRLDGEDLGVKTQQVTSSSVKAGNVVETDPAAGEKIECESDVTLLVSKGADLSTVPDVVGLQEADAEAQIRDADLIPNVETEDSDLPDGQVIAQTPASGSEVKKETEVVIRVSNGEGTVTVPNVEGQPEDTAVNQLESRGATNINVVPQETDDESLDGRVVDQAPPAGTKIRASDQVTIYVGEFVEPDPVDPDPDPDPDPDAPKERALRP